MSTAASRFNEKHRELLSGAKSMRGELLSRKHVTSRKKDVAFDAQLTEVRYIRLRYPHPSCSSSFPFPIGRAPAPEVRRNPNL